MVQLVVQPREPFEPEFLRRPGTFFYARLKRLTKLLIEVSLFLHYVGRVIISLFLHYRGQGRQGQDEWWRDDVERGNLASLHSCPWAQTSYSADVVL